MHTYLFNVLFARNEPRNYNSKIKSLFRIRIAMDILLFSMTNDHMIVLITCVYPWQLEFSTAAAHFLLKIFSKFFLVLHYIYTLILNLLFLFLYIESFMYTYTSSQVSYFDWFGWMYVCNHTHTLIVFLIYD